MISVPQSVAVGFFLLLSMFGISSRLLAAETSAQVAPRSTSVVEDATPITRPSSPSTTRPSSPSTTRPSSPSTTRPGTSSTTSSSSTTTMGGGCPVYSALPGSCTPTPNFEDPAQRNAIVAQCDLNSGPLVDPELTAGDKWQNCQVRFARCHCYDVQGVALYYRSGMCACLSGVNLDYCSCYRNCQNAPNPGRCFADTCGPAASAAKNKCDSDWRPGMTHGTAWAGFWNQTGCAAQLAACATLGIR